MYGPKKSQRKHNMPVKEIVKDKQALQVPCRECTIDEAQPIIQDLMDTAHFHKDNCAGLASNQVGSDLRVFVVKIRGKFVAFINPKFSPASGTIESFEGCLSFPGQKTKVTRYKLISVSPSKGKRKSMYLGGISAIAFQHELDHLNGITI